MSWRSLPHDMVDVILSNLALLELARIASTCHAFHALYRQQLAAVQEARTALAKKSFGDKRIKRISAVVDRFLKREPLGTYHVVRDRNTDYDRNIHRISLEGKIPRVFAASQRIHETCDAFVSAGYNGSQPLYYGRYDPDTLWVRAGDRSRLLMQIHRSRRGHDIV
jgi:hypothetical protein